MVLLIFLFLALQGVSAFTTSLSGVSGPFQNVSISETTDLYAYEINLDYTGTIDSVAHSNFLGLTSEATYSYNEKNNIVSVYGSRLDSSQTGVNGSGELFNITFDGSLTLRYTLAIYANGTEVYTYYNTSSGTPVVVTSSGGGGGGGGGGAAQFEVSPDLLKVEVTQGRTTRESIRLTNVAGTQIQIDEIDFGNLGQFVAAFLPQTPFSIPQGDYVDLSVDFFARTGEMPDVYTDEILIKTSQSQVSLPTLIEVVEEEPLFDLVVQLNKDKYSPGETAIATIDLQNFGEKTDIDVLMHYAIKDFAGETLVFEEGSYAIQGYKLQLVAKLDVPEDVEVGENLIFYARATYPLNDISATGSAVFTVVDAGFFPAFGAANLFLLILLPIAIIAILIVTIVIIFKVVKKPANVQKVVHPAEAQQKSVD